MKEACDYDEMPSHPSSKKTSSHGGKTSRKGKGKKGHGKKRVAK